MKFLTERTEIAKAINFNKYPVLRINMENDKGFMDTHADTHYITQKGLKLLQ